MARHLTRASGAFAALLTTVAVAAPAHADTAPDPAERLVGWNYDSLVRMFGQSWVGPRAVVEEGLPSLKREMQRGSITNASRKAAFLATLVSESAMRYDADQYGATDKYHGRGYIQLSGDFNYEAAGNYFDVNLLRNPERARSLRWSAPIARWYWTVARTTTNAYADAHDMNGVNRNIGFAWNYDEATRRCNRFKSAYRYFTGHNPANTICYPSRLPKPGSTDWYVNPQSKVTSATNSR
ncbi:MAG: glycoside hydrolase family 19 protein [Tetrasphaera sp.]